MNWTKIREGHFRASIDPEGDVIVDAIKLEDYNGDPVVTVLCTGHPIMTIEFGRSGESYQLLTPVSHETPQAQAMVSFARHVEGIEEDAEQAYVNSLQGDSKTGWEAFACCFEAGGDGHETCAMVDKIIELMKEEAQNDQQV